MLKPSTSASSTQVWNPSATCFGVPTIVGPIPPTLTCSATVCFVHLDVPGEKREKFSTVDLTALLSTNRNSSSSPYCPKSMPVHPQNKARAPSCEPYLRYSANLACASSSVRPMIGVMSVRNLMFRPFLPYFDEASSRMSAIFFAQTAGECADMKIASAFCAANSFPAFEAPACRSRGVRCGLGWQM